MEAKNRSLVFHNVVDLYEIPLLIHAIEKDYRFAVRIIHVHLRKRCYIAG